MPERILVVDDQPDTCELLKEALGRACYAVACAPDGEAAVEAVKSGPDRYDLIVLDLDFGPAKPDGLAALADLKRIDGDLPVVMLSGKGTIETAVQAMHAGAADFVEKTPYMADALLAVVQRELRAAFQLRQFAARKCHRKARHDAALDRFVTLIKRRCIANRIGYALVSTADHLGAALAAFLARRREAGRKASSKRR